MRIGVARASVAPTAGEGRGPSAEPAGRLPRAVFVGKAGLRSVTPGDLDRKFSVLARHLDAVVVAPGPAGRRVQSQVETFGVPRQLFYALGPVVAVALAAGRKAAVSCQSPFEAFPAVLAARLLPRRLRPAVVVEMRGDWRTATRLYGRSVRRVLAPLADRCASWTVARADLIRVIGDYTEQLARQAGYKGAALPLTTFSDLGQFVDALPATMPAEPRVAYVGALEPTKGVDVLLSAWAQVCERVPAARLAIAGDGAQREPLVAQARELGVDDRVVFLGRLSRPDVASLLDRSCLLVLPSRSEGLGRVIMEAHARARPVVGANVGGIPEQVEDGLTGSLVAPEDASGLAAAIVELLADPTRMERMGELARTRLSARDPRATYERHVSDFARWIEGRRDPD